MWKNGAEDKEHCRLFDGRMWGRLQYKYTPKFNIAPENVPSQKERIVFQPSFFSGYVKLRGSIPPFIEISRLNPRWLTRLQYKTIGRQFDILSKYLPIALSSPMLGPQVSSTISLPPKRSSQHHLGTLRPETEKRSKGRLWVHFFWRGEAG